MFGAHAQYVYSLQPSINPTFDALALGRSKSPEILYQHNVGFGEFILYVDKGLAVWGDTHSLNLARLFLEGPTGSGLTRCKFEECDIYTRELIEFEEIDSV
jgi:hypothetical protein